MKWEMNQKGINEDSNYNINVGEAKFNDWNSLAREIIQNSCDAGIHGKTVKINFELKTMTRNDFPCHTTIADVLELCASEEKSNDKAKLKFSQGCTQLQTCENFRALVITDENTTGLIGADRPCEDSVDNFWHALLHDLGSSQKKSKNSSGSMGMGKFATFNFTSTGTVFYSTKIGDAENQSAFMGISRVTTFKKDGELMSPKLVLCDGMIGKNHFRPIYGKNIPDFFKLDKVGTKIVIPNILHDTTDITEKMVDEVSKNFFVAIDREEMELNVFDTKIDSTMLQSNMESMKNCKEKEYYNAYKTGKQIQMENIGTLYLGIGNEYTANKINLLKNKGMLIEDIGSLKRNNSNVAGIFIIEDDSTCERVKKFESADHKKFEDPGKDSELYDDYKLISNIKKWIKDTVEKETEVEFSNEIDIDGMDELFSLDEKTEDVTTFKFKRKVKTNQRKIKQPNQSEVESKTGLDGGNNVGDGVWIGEGQRTTNGNEARSGSGDGNVKLAAGNVENDIIANKPKIVNAGKSLFMTLDIKKDANVRFCIQILKEEGVSSKVESIKEVLVNGKASTFDAGIIETDVKVGKNIIEIILSEGINKKLIANFQRVEVK